jgi:hypothetical protein
MVIAACNVSVHLGGAARPSLASAELKVAECMRSHRVPNFPDPSGGGGGFNLSGTGVNMQSPAFESAPADVLQAAAWRRPRRASCAGDGASSPGIGVHAAPRCFRLSRPTLKPPSNPNRAEYSIVDDRDGAARRATASSAPSPAPGRRRSGRSCSTLTARTSSRERVHQKAEVAGRPGSRPLGPSAARGLALGLGTPFGLLRRSPRRSLRQLRALAILAAILR